MNPSLSVLVTYHNEKKLLTECLQSMVSQMDPPEEILIYDDASHFPAKEYLVSSPVIRVIRGEENIGPGRARNKLLAEARSDYVHFHDSDDWFDPRWSEVVRSAMSEGADAIYTEVNSYDEEGKLAGEKVLQLKSFSTQEELVRFCIRHYMLVPAGTFQKSLAKELNGYRTSLWQSEDFDFNVRASLKSRKPKVILEPLAHIRLRRESRSQQRVETNTYAHQALLLLEKEIPSIFHSDLAEKASEVGAQLFRLGATGEAREAFETAKRLGPARYSREGILYRRIARILGQESAERMGDFYRRLLPNPLRRIMR